MIEDIVFLRPLWFLALIPAAVAIWTIWKYLGNPASEWDKVADPALIRPFLQISPKRRRYLPPLLLALGFILAITALAGPSWDKREVPVYQDRDALVIILDLSWSMAANDIAPSRLHRARHKLTDILQQRKQGQTALIVYAGDAHVVSPLTTDRNNIIALLPAMSPSIMPVHGNKLSEALATARELLKNSGMQEGQLLVLTDNVEDATAYSKASELKMEGITTSVIGIGTADGAPVPLPAGDGYFKDDSGQLVLAFLKENTLRELARVGGGEYNLLSLDNTDFRYLLDNGPSVYKDNLKREDVFAEYWIDRGAALCLVLIPLSLLTFRSGILSFIAPLFLVLCLLEPQSAQASTDWWDSLWQTPDQQGQKSFNSGDYETAGQSFADLEWKGSSAFRDNNFEDALRYYTQSDSVEAMYNKGNALANLERFEEAVKIWDKVLEQNPEHDDARHNRDYVLKLMEKDDSGDNKKLADDANFSASGKSEKDDKDSSASQDKESDQGDSSKEEQKGKDSDSKDSQQSKKQQDSEKKGSEGKKSEKEQQDGKKGKQGKEQDDKAGKTGKSGEKSETGQKDKTGEQDKTGDKGKTGDKQQADSQQAGKKGDKDKQDAGEGSNQTQKQISGSFEKSQNQEGKPQKPDLTGLEQRPQQGTPFGQPPPEHDKDFRHRPEDISDKGSQEDLLADLSQEQREAMQQWLQRIPDDPAELWRRKFYLNSKNNPQKQAGTPW